MVVYGSTQKCAEVHENIPNYIKVGSIVYKKVINGLSPYKHVQHRQQMHRTVFWVSSRHNF